MPDVEFVPLSSYERQALLNRQVCAPNDFSVSDEDYFAGNGRLARVRPPWPTEQPELVNSLQALAYVPFVVVLRANMSSPPRIVALLGLESEAANMLPAELTRMGTEQMVALTRRKDVHVIVIGG